MSEILLCLSRVSLLASNSSPPTRMRTDFAGTPCMVMMEEGGRGEEAEKNTKTPSFVCVLPCKFEIKFKLR